MLLSGCFAFCDVNHCLDPLFHWSLQNGDILILLLLPTLAGILEQCPVQWPFAHVHY